jgi:cell division septation protein DedD
MADVDIMDLFDKEFVTGEEETPVRTSGIADYKPTRSYGEAKPLKEKGGVRSTGSISSTPRTESTASKVGVNSVSDIDEKLVWVGAIFVFFGVFAFLLGYWLGNIKEKEITLAQKAKQEQVQQQIAEQKTELALKQTVLPVQKAEDVVQNPTPPLEEKPAQVVPVVPSLVEETTVSPASKPQTKPVQTTKPETKTTVKSTSPETKVETKPSSTGGSSYTIQVSAHTALEKAQNVEAVLRQSGFTPYIVETTINDVTYYRVRVGSYGSKPEAEEVLKKVKQSSVGKDAYILSLK